MSETMLPDGALDVQPLTLERWDDFEDLFGRNGACAGCWCMFWRQSRREFDRNHGEPNRQAIHALVENGAVPGLLAYQAGLPVGWVSVDRREAYTTLERSRILARVDDQPVWAITCFFIRRANRGQGVMKALIGAAVAYAAAQGAHMVEAYPTERHRKVSAAEIYMGVVPAFLANGFVEVARRSPTHPVMRRMLP